MFSSVGKTTLSAGVYEERYVLTEKKCPGLELCCLLTHATLANGPSIVTSPFSHLVFLSGIELSRWLKVAHSWYSMKRRCLFDNMIIR